MHQDHARSSTDASSVGRWAIVRLVLGAIQMTGAVAGFFFLARTGVSAWTVGACAAAGCVSVVS